MRPLFISDDAIYAVRVSMVGIIRMEKVKSSRCMFPTLTDIFVGGAGGVGRPVSGRITMATCPPDMAPFCKSMPIVGR